MRRLQTLVVDDEEAARSLLRRYIARRPDLDLAGEATDGPAAIRAIETLRPDLVLLDIEMPELDGFGVLQAQDRASVPPLIVFVTAFDRYAVRAFDFQAVDYLLKPVTPARFDQAIDQCRALALIAFPHPPVRADRSRQLQQRGTERCGLVSGKRYRVVK